MSPDRLDAWLDRLDPPARVNGMSMLDGYLTAIIVGSRSIPPDEWFDDLFGARGNIVVASGTMLAAIKAVVARFNAVSEGLAEVPARHTPIFEKNGGGQAFPHPWCMGFLAGMRLRFDLWRPLLDVDRVDHGLLLPILLHCADPDGRPMLEPPREGANTEEFLRTAYKDIPLAVPAIRDFWMPERIRQANGQS